MENTSLSRSLWGICILSIVLLASATAWDKVIHVDANAPGANDGTSWSDAYNYFQDALGDADSNEEPVEIWVAQGIYTPDSNSTVPEGTGDRGATFQLVNGVTVKGGYAGFGEPNENARDIVLYETILSGDLANDDLDVNDPLNLPGETSRAENSYHVLYSTMCLADTILDGVTIRGGNADGSGSNAYGGGLYNDQYSSPTINNCWFTANSATTGGGAMYSRHQYSKPMLTECVFTRNSSTQGAALFNEEISLLTFLGCTFTDNHASGSGGTILTSHAASTLTDCNFTNNTAAGSGGALFANDGSNVTMHTCSFIENSSNASGGGIYIEGDLSVQDCEFTQNSAAGSGGGISCSAGLDVEGTSFTNNSAGSHGGGIHGSGSTTVHSCPFLNNSAGSNGGAINGGTSIRDCSFAENSAGSEGGAINGGGIIRNCSFTGNYGKNGGAVTNPSTVIDCSFTENAATGVGGAIHLLAASPIITNCLFLENSADSGGGIYNNVSCSFPFCYYSHSKLTNCLFYFNSALETNGCGGAIHSSGNNTSTLRNCTIIENSAFDSGGGIYAAGSASTLANCILWANNDSASSSQDESAQIHGTAAAVNYCCIQGLTGNLGGEGNFGNDPLLVSLTGPDGFPGTGDEDLRLGIGSPCVDAADNMAVPADTADLDEDGNKSERCPYDLDVNLRFFDDPNTPDTGRADPPDYPGIVDMGAFERNSPSPTVTGECGDAFHPYPAYDFNKDCLVDFIDFALLAGHWMECTKPECY